jgi:inositol-hexakisphosphate kinase
MKDEKGTDYNKDKEWGKLIKNRDEFETNLHYYLHQASESTIKHFLDRLKHLFEWMKDQRRYRFYSSSLLFVYEGHPNTPSNQHNPNIRMIDFASVYENHDGGLDEGYLKGLGNLIQMFEKMITK